MKNNLYASFLAALFLCAAAAGLSAAAPQTPEIKAVISEKRIWLLTDEVPVKSLRVEVRDCCDKVVLQKHFDSKMTDWSLEVAHLPQGSYSLHIGDTQVEKFRK